MHQGCHPDAAVPVKKNSNNCVIEGVQVFRARHNWTLAVIKGCVGGGFSSAKSKGTDFLAHQPMHQGCHHVAVVPVNKKTIIACLGVSKSHRQGMIGF